MAAEDANLQPGLIAAAAILITMTSLALAMRMTARIGILGGFEWDDGLIIAAWLFCVSLCGASIGATAYGFGLSGRFVDESLLPNFRIAIMVCSASFSFGVACAKASFAILYLRILQPQTRLLTWTNRVLIVFLAGQAIEEMLITVLQCRPVQATWENPAAGTCISLVPMWWTTFVFNLTTDLILFVQPIPAMWRLQLPLAKRVGLIVMLSLGLLVCIISIIRIVHVQRIGRNPTLELAEPMIWSMVEIAALVLCSCLPFLRQILSRIPWLNRALGLNSSRNGPKYYPRPTYADGSTTVGGGNKSRSGGGGGSIPLKSRSRASYRFGASSHQPLSSGNSKQFGTTSRAERAKGSSSPEENGSTEDIFAATPQAIKEGEGNGAGIMVTHEVMCEVDEESFHRDADDRSTSDLVDDLGKPPVLNDPRYP